MKSFPPPLRFSIPTILILCGGLLGINSFHQEITETYQLDFGQKADQISFCPKSKPKPV